MLSELMTTREAADYLRIKERKLYELVHDGAVPCSRVGGKWVFPRRFLEAWVLRHAEGLDGLDLGAPRPPVIAGSHDPLLEWAARESGSDLALLVDGSLAGLRRFAAGKAVACGLHVPETGDSEHSGWNVSTVRHALTGTGFVLLEWAVRDQGLLLHNGNPEAINNLADLVGRRVVGRQDGAGSRLLFDRLATAAGLDPAGIARTDPPARSETDVAVAVANGAADAGFGIGALATAFGLDFLPLATERYDLVLTHRDYFEPPLQALLRFAATPCFAEKARSLGGYDVSNTGRVRFNGTAWFSQRP